MRKLKRAVAKRRMKAAGIQGACKKKAWGSYFSQNWREWALPIAELKKKKKKSLVKKIVERLGRKRV